MIRHVQAYTLNMQCGEGHFTSAISFQKHVVDSTDATRGLQEIRVATREDSRVLCFPSRRGLTPRGILECNPEIPALQLCPTLCDPTDGSPSGSAVPGILQARILEWGAIAFSATLHYVQQNQS